MKYLTIAFPDTMSLRHLSLEDRVDVVFGSYHSRGRIITKIEDCTEENPCCARRGEYNGFGSGTLLFECPKNCSCHD